MDPWQSVQGWSNAFFSSIVILSEGLGYPYLVKFECIQIIDLLRFLNVVIFFFFFFNVLYFLSLGIGVCCILDFLFYIFNGIICDVCLLRLVQRIFITNNIYLMAGFCWTWILQLPKLWFLLIFFLTIPIRQNSCLIWEICWFVHRLIHDIYTTISGASLIWIEHFVC